jgi:hypothetical protein
LLKNTHDAEAKHFSKFNLTVKIAIVERVFGIKEILIFDMN